MAPKKRKPDVPEDEEYGTSILADEEEPTTTGAVAKTQKQAAATSSKKKGKGKAKMKDNEDFDDEDLDVEGGATGRKNAFKPRQTTKKVVMSAQEDDMPVNLSFSVVALDPLPMAETPYTQNIGAWNLVKDSLKTVLPQVAYTPLGLPMRPILECLPRPQDKRNFQMIGQPYLDNNANRGKMVPGTTKRAAGTISCYRFKIQNKANKKSKVIECFGKGQDQMGRAALGGALDTNVVTNIAEVTAIAKRLCHIYNTVGFDIDEAALGGTRLPTYQRRAEALAMASLNGGQFDHGTLYDDYLVTRRYGLGHDIIDMEQDVIRCSYHCFVNDEPNIDFNCIVNLAKLDLTKADSIEDVPDWFFYAGHYKGKKVSKTNPRLIMGERLLRRVQFKMFGLTGSNAQQKLYVDDLILPFLKLEAPKAGTAAARVTNSGAFGGLSALRMPRMHGNAIEIENNSWAQKAVEGGALPIWILTTFSLVMIAYVYQVFHDVFASGRGVMNAFQAFAVACDMVNLGMISRETAIRAHCLYYSGRALNICIMLSRLEDGRLVCPRCKAAGIGRFGADDDFTSESLRKRLVRNVRNLLRADARAANVDEDPALIDKSVEKLSESIDWDTSKWQDGYNGERADDESKYEDALTSRSSYSLVTVQHPKRMSVEAPGIGIIVAGIAFYHHWLNIILTCLSLNLLKGPLPAGVMPWFKAGLQQSIREDDGGQRDAAFWRRYDTAMDHCYIIRLIVSRLKAVKLRELLNLPVTYFDQLKSLIWDGITMPPASRCFNTRAVGNWITWQYKRLKVPLLRQTTATAAPRKTFDPWTVADLARLKIFHQLVYESPILNPKGLPMMPLLHGLPYFWRKDTMPINDTPDEYAAWLFDEMASRYRTTDEDCDPEHETDESPDTYLCLLIVQWYDNGRAGTDIFIHCEMVPFAGHPQCYSIGRRPEVLPKSQLKTGFTSLKPATLSDYNDSIRTAIVELWRVNVYKFNYPTFGPDNMLPTLKQILLGIVDSCEWYDAADASRDVRAAIPFPTRSTRRIGTKLFRAGVEVQGADMQDLFRTNSTVLLEEEDLVAVLDANTVEEEQLERDEEQDEVEADDDFRLSTLATGN